MANKIPPDAFDIYFAMGPARSYEAVAKKFGVSKRSITSLASRESWQKRISEMERKARQGGDQRKIESLQVIKEQHLQALRLVLGKGVEGLKQMPITTPADCIKAIGLAVREIRIEMGEPSDRTAISVEDTIRREYERWMISAPPEEEEGHEADEEIE